MKRIKELEDVLVRNSLDEEWHIRAFIKLETEDEELVCRVQPSDTFKYFLPYRKYKYLEGTKDTPRKEMS